MDNARVVLGLLVVIAILAAAYYAYRELKNSTRKNSAVGVTYHYQDALERSCKLRGGFMDPDGHCYSCPPGDRRTLDPISSPKACADYGRSPPTYSPAHKIF